MKKIILLALSLFAIYSSSISQIESVIPSDKPKLVVGIVVEQMRQDYLERFWNNLGDKGFKKLAINGSFCQNANYEYSLTQAAPGYATIVTGCEPSEHGIVSDYWFNALTGNKEHCIETKSYKTIGGNPSNFSYSPKNILTTTFSDEAKLFGQGKSKTISVSLDPIGAIISGGYTADAAYWFDTKTGNWVSSTYYMNELPAWVKEQNDKKMPDDYLQREWSPLLETEKYNTAQADSSIYEYGIDMVYKTFPYKYEEISKSIKDYELLNLIPEGQTHLTDMAIAALYNEELGKDKFTDFLFINYSVSENIGKLFGPQSMEVEDLFLRLDRDLGHLISVIEDVVGKNNVLIYLTSNHGVSENPEYLADNKMPTGVFKQHYILTLLRSYLKAIYGEGDWVLDYNNNQIYLNKTLIEDSQISLNEFQEKVISFIINSAGISNAISSHQFQNIIFTQGMPKKMQNSFNQKRSGDIMISLKAGWIEDIPFVCNHNSGYKYDTNVPLIWYGWKVKKQNIFNNVNITSIAPTISKILNTPAPPASTGEVLNSVFNNK